MAIAQPVVDQGEQLPSGGHDTDVATAAGTDPVPDLPEAGVLADPLHALHRGPADQPAALLGDPPTVERGVGLVVFGGQPAQLLSCAGPGKRATSPISATNTAPST